MDYGQEKVLHKTGDQKHASGGGRYKKDIGSNDKNDDDDEDEYEDDDFEVDQKEQQSISKLKYNALINS